MITWDNLLPSTRQKLIEKRYNALDKMDVSLLVIYLTDRGLAAPFYPLLTTPITLWPPEEFIAFLTAVGKRVQMDVDETMARLHADVERLLPDGATSSRGSWEALNEVLGFDLQRR